MLVIESINQLNICYRLQQATTYQLVHLIVVFKVNLRIDEKLDGAISSAGGATGSEVEGAASSTPKPPMTEI
jgi:hypothetical protein